MAPTQGKRGAEELSEEQEAATPGGAEEAGAGPGKRRKLGTGTASGATKSSKNQVGQAAKTRWGSEGEAAIGGTE
eukprot:452407-Pelagomonas_calceolata.AAC.3